MWGIEYLFFDLLERDGRYSRIKTGIIRRSNKLFFTVRRCFKSTKITYTLFFATYELRGSVIVIFL